jgi:hypothetical protein
MKHIIICGGDQLGKSSLIEGLLKHYNYDNVTVRHFSKPQKTTKEYDDPLKFQLTCFEKEGNLLETIRQMEEDEYVYYENIVLWNRSHYGEYVYGQMFRGLNPLEIETYISNFDERFLLCNDDTFFVLLTADPLFFFKQEDGKSLSNNVKQKTKEIQLFDTVFNKSSIRNKIKIKVNDGQSFVPKQDVLNQVLNFLKDA